jgi:hypothetical protein
MIFIFNNLQDKNGIWNCPDVNSSRIKRFTPSPLITTLIRYKQIKQKFNNYDPSEIVVDSYKNRKLYSNFIIPTGVNHSPWDWTGYTDLDKKYDQYISERKTIFYYLDKKLLSALRKNRAYLLLDQSHEGYHTDWLFDWFHDACYKYEIDPSRIIYVTGNLAVEEQYRLWCKNKNPSSKMCVVPNIQFEGFINDAASKQENLLPTVDTHIEYKLQNIIKTYNCFQKRPRPHRAWMFYYLYKNNLLNDGINSMNSFAHRNTYYDGRIMAEEDYNEIVKLLPIYPRKDLSPQMQESFKGPLGGKYEQDLYHQEVRDSWVSVISEASYAEDTCFISEKSFKPIVSRHPFIMCGNKNSLKYLKELGYKTFEGFIDESYDNMDTWDRYDAIVNNIKTIQSMTESQKIDWFMSMRDILDHNFQNLKCNTEEKIPESVLKIKKYIEGQ